MSVAYRPVIHFLFPVHRKESISLLLHFMYRPLVSLAMEKPDCPARNGAHIDRLSQTQGSSESTNPWVVR
jgi:hypothetical protein